MDHEWDKKGKNLPIGFLYFEKVKINLGTVWPGEMLLAGTWL